MTAIENYSMVWEGIEISMVFKPDYFPSVGVSHLEVSAGEELPFTDSGYRSIWVLKDELDGITIKQYVLNALNADSNTKKWKAYLVQKAKDKQAKTQLSLF